LKFSKTPALRINIGSEGVIELDNSFADLVMVSSTGDVPHLIVRISADLLVASIMSFVGFEESITKLDVHLSCQYVTKQSNICIQLESVMRRKLFVYSSNETTLSKFSRSSKELVLTASAHRLGDVLAEFKSVKLGLIGKISCLKLLNGEDTICGEFVVNLQDLSRVADLGLRVEFSETLGTDASSSGISNRIRVIAFQ
jgi:hypothetical protein